MRTVRSLVVLAIGSWLLSLSSAPAFGGRIQLDSQVDCRAGSTDPTIDCTIEISHRGDEAAQFGAVTVDTLDLEKPIGSWSKLEPGTSWQADFHLTAPELPGRRPIVVSIAYEDAAGYPFGVVAHGYYGNAGDNAALQARLANVELETGPVKRPPAATELELQYNGPVPVDAELRWFLPRDLSDKPSTESVRLEPGEKIVRFHSIDNFSGFAGSKYRIYALLTWNEQGHNYSQFVPGEVFLAGFEPPTERFRTGVALLLGLLIGSGLGPIVRTFRARWPNPQPG